MKSLFVMDPLDRINVRGDSTYMTMHESTARGFPVSYCTPDRLFVRDGTPYALATPVRTTAEPPHFHVDSPSDVPLAAFDVIWMRKDPPFDMTYVFSTYVLDLVPKRTLVVNDPIGLKVFNEKLWAMHFAQFQPKSLLTNDKARILAFAEEVGGPIVMKPWDGNGGRGVVVSQLGDRNLPSLIELHTQDGRTYCIVQQYIPGIVKGDKRILIFDGDPVAGVLRVPSEKDHRGNIHVGARVEPTTLTEREQEICAALRPHLQKHGQIFVGIDVIDGFLTEINVTSPTGIQEANRLYGLALEKNLVDCAIRRHAERA